VYENSAIGVALTDLNGRFLAVNRAYEEMLGYAEKELRKLTFLEITEEDYRDANWELVSELLEGADSFLLIWNKHGPDVLLPSAESRRARTSNRWEHYIRGASQAPSSGVYMESFDPRVGEAVATVSVGRRLMWMMEFGRP
jgi:PAS domain-containing protein